MQTHLVTGKYTIIIPICILKKSNTFPLSIYNLIYTRDYLGLIYIPKISSLIFERKGVNREY